MSNGYSSCFISLVDFANKVFGFGVHDHRLYISVAYIVELIRSLNLQLGPVPLRSCRVLRLITIDLRFGFHGFICLLIIELEMLLHDQVVLVQS